jgi:hypothetical protein
VKDMENVLNAKVITIKIKKKAIAGNKKKNETN